MKNDQNLANIKSLDFSLMQSKRASKLNHLILHEDKDSCSVLLF